MTRKTQAAKAKEATKPAETKAEEVKPTLETRHDEGEPGQQIDGQGLVPAAEDNASKGVAKINTPAKDDKAKVPKPQGKQGEIPALFIRTKRRFKSRRRAGFRFTREGHGIALDALSKEQVAALKADPVLEVEECTFPADEAEG